MSLDAMIALVSSNLVWFRGENLETHDTLAEAERRLGLSLPESLKWLLYKHGYSSACGVPNLADSVKMTLRCRISVGLPAQYLILEDKGDAGVVVLDTASPDGKVIWLASHAIERLGTGEIIEDCDQFTDFSTWVSRCLEDVKEDFEPAQES